MALDLGLTTYQLLSTLDSVALDIQTRSRRLDEAIDRALDRRQTYGMPPGDMWSDGETIWVTNRTGKIDAYHLPDRPLCQQRVQDA